MRLLAIDPGLVCAGWAVVSPSAEAATGRVADVLAVGTIETSADTDLAIADDARRRCFEVVAALDEIAKIHRAEALRVEAFTVQKSLTWRAVQVLRLLGRLEEWGEARGLGYGERTTQSIKARIGARVPKGEDAKLAVQARVAALTGFEVGGSKVRRAAVADAIAVGLAEFLA